MFDALTLHVFATNCMSTPRPSPAQLYCSQNVARIMQTRPYPQTQKYKASRLSCRSLQGAVLHRNLSSGPCSTLQHIKPCIPCLTSYTWLLAGLRSLNLSHNKLHRIQGLEAIPSLRDLNLDHNHLKHLDPGCFSSCSRLRRLSLVHKGLRRLSHFHPLVKLHPLNLSANRITDVADLDRLSALTSLQDVTLSDNLVTKKQWYRAVTLSKCPNLLVSSTMQATCCLSGQFVCSPVGCRLSSRPV